MTDELLDKLGTYFVYFRIRERYGITFERFVQVYDRVRYGGLTLESLEVRRMRE